MTRHLMIAALLLAEPVRAEPSFRLTDAATIQVSWPAECGKQYGVSCSFDLETWSPLGGRLLGIDGTLAVEDDVSGAAEKYYRVEEFDDFVLDLSRLKFGTVGNKWNYQVTQDGILGSESYTWETEITQHTTFGGEEVFEWRFLRDGSFAKSIYLLDDFSAGIYEVGGEDALQGTVTNSPPAPSMLADFSPGEIIPVNYTTSTALGQNSVSEEMTITIDKNPLTVGAGTFTGLLKVTHQSEGSLSGFVIRTTTTEWFALDIGLVKHVGEVDVAGSIASTTFELQSFEVGGR